MTDSEHAAAVADVPAAELDGVPASPGSGDSRGSTYGPLEATVRADIEALMTEHPMGESLAELAYRLAATLDGEPEERAVAGIAKELRATLAELAAQGVDDDDDFADGLSAPSRNTPDAE